jgi:5'-3' exonuclease
MSLLIDSDILVYRVACTCEDEVEQVAKWRIDDSVNDIYEATEATDAIFYLTGTNNFRKRLDPTYKANRTQERPKHWQACRDYLAKKYKAIVVDNYEADDALGWSQTEHTTICSIDKDLLMIPGKHYNWVRKEWTTVTEDSANQTFYRQLLIGDVSDNVFGMKGIGPKKAEKALGELSTVEELFEKVRSMYDDDKRLLLNCNLLWIMRKEGEMWQDKYPHLASVLFSSTEEGMEL